jgi:hypothetical protein
MNNINQDAKDIAKKPNKMREKISLVVLGLCLAGLFFLPSDIEKVTEYTPPAISKLNVTTGKVDFALTNRGSGGDLILDGDKNKLTLICASPNSRLRNPCYLKNKNGETINFKSNVIGKLGKAWWEPINGMANGRLYQLEVDGKIFINYEDMSEQYSAYFKKNQ